MIVVRLMGGLGNQMFQYAFGRSMASYRKTDLKFDASWFIEADEKIRRNLLLTDFPNIKIKNADSMEIEYLQRKMMIKRIVRKITRIPIQTAASSYVEEKKTLFSSSLFNKKLNLYFSGFWQTEKYFVSIKDTVFDDFAFPAIQSSAYQQFEKTIARSRKSVSVHYRRGDYVDNKDINSFHGVCPEAYYLQGIETISRKINEKQLDLFIFSDDVQWVKGNNFFPAHNVVYIDTESTNRNDITEMHLMSLCRHNVIANSSFSWWGAWLNGNEQKCVIAPKKWFQNAKANENTRDLIPDGWIRI